MNNWENALNSALQAAERGYAVFPLSLNKTPAIKSPHDRGHSCKGDCGLAGHGVHDATSVPAHVRILFDLAPRAVGYGISCRDRFVGLDLDRKNGVDGVASLNQLAGRHGFVIPQSMTVCTPSGGFHLWLSIPAGVTVPNSAGRLGPGIDVRGTGGYVVGPGSHGKAGRYVVHPRLGNIAVQPVPEQLLKLMLPPPAPRRPVRQEQVQGTPDAALNGLLRVVLSAPEGTRNDRLYWAAAKAWAHVGDGHMDALAAETALVDAAVSRGLAEAEARRTIASARRTTAGAA
ncbi:bifunctional DNA primase/polymerase [Streptomyces lunaelactis]|uniref:bifunctional DNA primase/polymerase n=1 Tax=Streptomyces lunaelactis TaxID=1535768 RepID=UPI0028152902|nr:bifunctional DNA primase/polymerase [Streptomyces lunaelactis]